MPSTDSVTYIDRNVSRALCKKFSRLDLSISNYAFDTDVVWCRFVFNEYETRNQARHSHSFYELHLCLSGYAVFEDKNNNKLTIYPGEFILFPPKQNHKLCEVGENFSKFVFGFNLELKCSDEYTYFKNSFANIPIKVWMASKTMLETPQRILDDMKQNDKCFKLMASEILSTVIIEIARIIGPKEKKECATYENKDKRLDNLILYMRDNIHRNLTVEDFAAYSKMSSKQLNRIMFEHYNISVAEFFRKERIEKSKELLTHTELSISQIAHKMGFGDEFSMSRIFKRIEGMTPSKYRSSYFSK